MKNLIFVGVILMLLVSCQDNAPIDYIILSGKITNSPTGEISINSMDFKVDRSTKYAFQKTIPLADNGSFTDTIQIDKGIYKLSDGVHIAYIYLDKGNTITLNANSNDFENTLTFSGAGSDISNYYLAKQKKEKETFGDATSKFDVLGLDEDAFKAKFKNYNESLIQLFSSYERISEELKTLEERSINYDYLQMLSIYETFHNVIANNLAEFSPYKSSEGFLDELKELIYDNERDFLYSTTYRDIVESYYREQGDALAKQDSIPNDIAMLKVLGDIKNETIKNGLLGEMAKREIAYTEDIETYYRTFIQVSNNDDDKEDITAKYNNMKMTAKGMPSPKFMSYRNHAGGTTSLDDLQGKYVYIDVWATWCGPCKYQIPFLKKVEKTYHDKNIEFVSISIDHRNDFEKWKKMVVDMELGGTQLIADKDWASQFIQDYVIKGIPRFILIDPNGNIVNAKAPRPSEPELIALFNELNI